MANHKPLCWVVVLLVVIGAVNWGLVGLGGLIGQNLNVVHLILGGVPVVENIVYLLVGVSGLGLLAGQVNNKNCSCMNGKMDKMK